MPEETTAAPATPQAGATVNTPAQAATNTTPDPQAGDGQEQIMSLDEARKIRKENQTLRQRQKTIDEAEEARQQAALSDLEKANKRATDLEQQLQQYRQQLVESEVRNALLGKNLIVNTDLIAPAIMQKLEYENGKPTNLQKVLDEVAKANPTLFKAEATSPAQTNAPALPANNPGRSYIPSPAGGVQPNKPLRLADLQWNK